MPNAKRPKKLKKNSQLVIRINKHERDEFVELCDELDTSASREIRRFMKEFIELHQAGHAAADIETPAPDTEDGDTEDDDLEADEREFTQDDTAYANDKED